MRLLSINASQEEKQLYIQNQILNRGINVTNSVTSNANEGDVTVDGNVSSVLVEANPNRKSLYINNPTANDFYVSTLEDALTLGIKIVAGTTENLNPAPTQKLYIYSDSSGTVTYLEL